MFENHAPKVKSGKPSQNSGEFLVIGVLILAFMLFIGLQQGWVPKASLPASDSQTQSPIHHAEAVAPSLLMAGGQESARSGNFGWLTFIARPLYMALRFLHDHGIDNWGWSIIGLTAIFNLLIIWPRIMSIKSSLRMMRVQPKVDALKKRYSHLKINDPRRAEMNEELMALYKAEGAQMFGGCLPLILQMPLLFAYMAVLRNATELHQAHWLWLRDLSLPDPLHVLPLLITASMVLTQWITPAAGMSSSQRRLMAILLPAVMGFSLWHYASGLSLYWVTGNMMNLLFQFAVNRSRAGKEMRALALARAPK